MTIMIVHVDTYCNRCDHRTEHHTQTEAFASCQAHEIMTDHDDQLVATPANGWNRYRALNYSLTASGRARARELYG